MSVTEFGRDKTGAPIREVAIAGGGLSARLIEWGCVLRDLRLDGVDQPLTLGLETLADYEARSPHFGAIAGRVANRIGPDGFALEGERYRPTLNQAGRATLHGGAAGFGKRAWRLIDHGPDEAIFGINDADGAEGFPGALNATCRYRLVEGRVEIDLTATATRPTLCNLAQHSYFNLSDEAKIDGHELWLAAARFTPIDDDLVPTGAVDPAPPAFDFRAARPVGAVAMDHNFVLAEARRETPTLAARLSAGGVEMSLATTEPGLQVYTGDKVALDAIGLGGRSYGARAGICLESQVWPDAPNHAGFPSAEIRPETPYRQRTILSFRRI